MKTREMILCSLFCAVICVFSVITIPIGAVPMTLSVLSIMLCGLILRPKTGMISVILYICLGAVGIPVFSGFRGGFNVLIGPTGGYIWSYVFMILIIALISKIQCQSKIAQIFRDFFSCFTGLAVCYVFGTAQFMAVAGANLYEALAVCVFPFIVFDVIKAVAAAAAGYELKRILSKII